MKINFNRPHSESLQSGEVRFGWLDAHLREFLRCHDLTIDTKTTDFIYSPVGIKIVGEWLAATTGMKVSYWEIDYRIREGAPPIAYGLDFCDDCPKFIEAKLRHT